MKYAAKKLSALIITLFMVSVLAFLAFQIGWPASCPETWAPATAIKCLWQT